MQQKPACWSRLRPEAEVTGDEPRSIDRPVGVCLDLEVPIRQGRQGRIGDNNLKRQASASTPSKWESSRCDLGAHGARLPLLVHEQEQTNRPGPSQGRWCQGPGDAKAGDWVIKESREMARAGRPAEEIIEESRGTGEPTARQAGADYTPQTAVQHNEASSATVKCG